MVTPALFKRYPDARALAKATTAELEPQIQSTGFFRAKSKSLIGMAQALVEQHGGEVPATMDALVELPGVGRKTANVVLGHALGVPGLPVDRHVLRVANRIGIAESDDPEVVEQQLCARDAAGGVDADVRHADPARPPHLQAEAALRPVRRPRRLRLLPTVVARSRQPARVQKQKAAGDRVTRAALRPSSSMTRCARHPAALPRRDEEHRHRRRGRAVAGAARRDGDRAARHAVRPLPGHAAHRARLGVRQHAARSHLDLPGADRGGVRRRRGRSATASPRR